MVRKTTAVDVTETTKTKTSSTEKSSDDYTFDIQKFLMDARHGATENSHMLIGIVFLLLGLIVLKEFLVGMILVTAGILWVSGFFKKK